MYYENSSKNLWKKYIEFFSLSKNKSYMKDFFTRYRQSQKNPIVIPAIFALMISFSVVGTMKE